MPKKILFLYPNLESEIRIPLAISILISLAKRMGNSVELFDTTFMVPNSRKDDHLQEDLGILKKTNIDDLIGVVEPSDLDRAWSEKVSNFMPDYVVCSLLERNYKHSVRFLSMVHNVSPLTKILVGGILPTIDINFVIENMGYVDAICIGEGEKAFENYLNGIFDYNLYKKQDNGMFVPPKNGLLPYVSMDEIPHQDWTLFDKRHMLKALDGHVYVGGSFEFSRGCHRTCTFCVAPSLRASLSKSGKPIRRKSVANMIYEIESLRKDYYFNIVSFCDVGFLNLLTNSDREEFTREYNKRINLPYIIQASAPNLAKEENVIFLKETNCVTVSVGVESGNSHIRYDIMKKNVSDEQIIRAFYNLRKYNIRSTANFMIGLPEETEKDILETIEFCKKIRPNSIAAHYFCPFLGTDLYNYCLKKGYYTFDPDTDVYDGSPLDMPQISKGKLKELMEKFTKECSNLG